MRQATLAKRVEETVRLIRAEPDESWLVWCGLNEEGRAVGRTIPDAVVVEGSDDPDAKATALRDFAEGRTRVLVTKLTVAGFGMNFQRCARMAFVGLGYSYEQYYQGLRRCYRYGQPRVVHAHIMLSDLERPILDAVKRKEHQAQRLSGGLLAEVRAFERRELMAGTSAEDDYAPRRPLTIPPWLA